MSNGHCNEADQHALVQAAALKDIMLHILSIGQPRKTAGKQTQIKQISQRTCESSFRYRIAKPTQVRRAQGTLKEYDC